MDFFHQITFVVGVTILLALLAKFFKQPLIISYILSGIIVGPYFLNIVNNFQVLDTFSQMGIALLLFIVGLGLLDNIIPFIGGEEEKSELEPSKILGRVVGGEIVEDNSIKISAHCNRVPVVDGHTACVSLSFKEKPIMEEIIKAWTNFSSVPQELNLPSAPKKPIIYSTEQDRPQPRKDRDSEGGMAVTIGRLRECKVFDYRFVGLSHNTIRGAAGGGILNAELLKAKNYL